MSWLSRLLGDDKPPAPPVKEALDAARAANESTHRSMQRVRDYWEGQRDASERLMDEYEEADVQRTRDRRLP